MKAGREECYLTRYVPVLVHAALSPPSLKIEHLAMRWPSPLARRGHKNV